MEMVVAVTQLMMIVLFIALGVFAFIDMVQSRRQRKKFFKEYSDMMKDCAKEREEEKK